METEPKQSATWSRTEITVLLVLAATQFTSIVDFVVIMPLQPRLMEALSIGPTKFGLLVASYTFAAGLAGLVASSIVDRFDRRTAFLTLYAGFLLGTLQCGLARSYTFLLVARIATGAFGGLLGGMSMAIIGDVFPDERRGRATGAMMSGFALATVLGVPIGFEIGSRFGWYMPFLCLVLMGTPILIASLVAMPRLVSHLGKAHAHPLRSLADTFMEPAHWNAFALMIVVMLGVFSVAPFISGYLVSNAGYPESELIYIYIAGGLLTLVGAPLIGKLADRYGKLTVYRCIVPISAILLVTITNLPPVAVPLAVALVALLMLSNTGRMVSTFAMITGSVQRERRGSFMSATSSVQHLSTSLAASLYSVVVRETPDHRILHYGVLGWIAAVITLASAYVAGRVQIVDDAPIDTEASLVAAAEANFDVGEPMVGA